MKVKALTKLINDHGTKPHIEVLCKSRGEENGLADYLFLAYEGKPQNLTSDIENLSVSSVTILGEGFLRIYCTREG